MSWKRSISSCLCSEVAYTGSEDRIVLKVAYSAGSRSWRLTKRGDMTLDRIPALNQKVIQPLHMQDELNTKACRGLKGLQYKGKSPYLAPCSSQQGCDKFTNTINVDWDFLLTGCLEEPGRDLAPDDRVHTIGGTVSTWQHATPMN